jgi:hypothetical protein
MIVILFPGLSKKTCQELFQIFFPRNFQTFLQSFDPNKNQMNFKFKGFKGISEISAEALICSQQSKSNPNKEIQCQFIFKQLKAEPLICHPLMIPELANSSLVCKFLLVCELIKSHCRNHKIKLIKKPLRLFLFCACCFLALCSAPCLELLFFF